MKPILPSNPVLKQAIQPIHEEAERVRAALKVSNTAASGLHDDGPMLSTLERQLKGASTPLPGAQEPDPRQSAMIESLKTAVAALKALEGSYKEAQAEAEKSIGPHGRAIQELDARIQQQSQPDNWGTRGLQYLGEAGQQLFNASLAHSMLRLKKELKDVIDLPAVAKVLEEARPGVEQLEKSIAALKKNNKAVSDVIPDAPLFQDPVLKKLKGMKLVPLLRALSKLLLAKPIEPKNLLTGINLSEYPRNLADHLDEIADTAALGRKPVYLQFTVDTQNCGGYIRDLFDAIQSADHHIEELGKKRN